MLLKTNYVLAITPKDTLGLVNAFTYLFDQFSHELKNICLPFESKPVAK